MLFERKNYLQKILRRAKFLLIANPRGLRSLRGTNGTPGVVGLSELELLLEFSKC